MKARIYRFVDPVINRYCKPMNDVRLHSYSGETVPDLEAPLFIVYREVPHIYGYLDTIYRAHGTGWS